MQDNSQLAEQPTANTAPSNELAEEQNTDSKQLENNFKTDSKQLENNFKTDSKQLENNSKTIQKEPENALKPQKDVKTDIEDKGQEKEEKTGQKEEEEKTQKQAEEAAETPKEEEEKAQKQAEEEKEAAKKQAEEEGFAHSEEEPIQDFENVEEGINIDEEYYLKMGVDVLNMVDGWIANSLAVYGGGHPNEYKTHAGLKQQIVIAGIEVLKHKKIKAPTPTQTLIGLLLAMVVPPLIKAGYKKYMLPPAPTAAPTVVPSPRPQEEAENTEVNYQNCHEFQENRQFFKVQSSNGSYQTQLVDGKWQYVKVNETIQMPSPEIQKLIDEGLSSKQIKNIIYG